MPKTYLIVGDDPFIKEREETRLRDKFLKPGELELNYSVHRPDEVERIMDSAGTLPFLAERRVVLVRDIQEMPDAGAEAVLSYLEKKTDGKNVLIFSADNPFRKTKRFRRLSGLAEVVKADRPDEATVKKWIRSFFKREGIEITPQAVNLLVELKGTDTAGVKAELEKLFSFSGGERIEESHVEDLVGRSVTETVFKLVDAINSKDTAWALRILEDLYDQKKKHQDIVGYLAWHIRMVQKVKYLSGKGFSSQAIAGELGYKPGFVKRLEAQSRKYTPERTAAWLASLLEADRIIKTSRFKPDLAMEMLVVGLINS